MKRRRRSLKKTGKVVTKSKYKLDLIKEKVEGELMQQSPTNNHQLTTIQNTWASIAIGLESHITIATVIIGLVAQGQFTVGRNVGIGIISVAKAANVRDQLQLLQLALAYRREHQIPVHRASVDDIAGIMWWLWLWLLLLLLLPQIEHRQVVLLLLLQIIVVVVLSQIALPADGADTVQVLQ